MTEGNIAGALAEVASRLPDSTALIKRRRGGYTSWTFRQLDDHASAYAHGLAGLGIGRGDRAVLMVRPSLEFICLTFALFRLGTPVVLIDPGMGYRNLLRCIASVGPTVFVGIPRAQIFRLLSPRHFSTVRKSICVGPGPGALGISLAEIADFRKGSFPVRNVSADDLAAIIFTTGSTGPPKGVRYGHGIFQAQLEMIRDYYGITENDIDQPAFPLFALFSTALGACAVIPDMDPAHPARVNPARFVRTVVERKVTYSFGSPAIWNVVSRYCIEKGILLSTVRQVLMAGAPVSGELIGRVRSILPEEAVIHTPYGATEALPVASFTGGEVLGETWAETRKGKGICVGPPMKGVDIRIVRTSDAPLPSWQGAEELPEGEIGEIVVRGPVVTRGYDNNDGENRMAKIDDDGSFWHRMGDLGYLDGRGRLWFCGRRAHRVKAAEGVMYTIPCEAVFNEHPAVYRSALVGVPMKGREGEVPVIIVEPHGRCSRRLQAELRELAKANELTRNIEHFLVKRNFPVDIRHSAKIFREKLAVWAAGKLA